MKLISPGALSYHKNLTFVFSNTLRNETVNISQYSSDYVIAINGEVYSSGSGGGDNATVVIIGGSDRFINEKTERLASTFYMSEPQKLTLYKAIKELSKRTDSANITSDNDKLEQSITALYRNFCG
jgi:hypothetical protein